MEAKRIERAATVNGAGVNIIVEWNGEEYHARATDLIGRGIASVPAVTGPFFTAEVTRLQRVALDAAREALGGDGRSLEQIADEMGRNGELTTARSYHRSMRRR